MQASRSMTVDTDENGKLIYQMIETEAVCLRNMEYPNAYSILVLRSDGDSVVESNIVYDVSRRGEVCLEIMKEMCANGVAPENAKCEAELLL